jgi:hypothetical protein
MLRLLSILSPEPEARDFFGLSAANYVCALAAVLEAPENEPTLPCTMAHLAVAVTLVDANTVLTAAARTRYGKELVQPLLTARDLGTGGQRQISMVRNDAIRVVSQYYDQTDEPTRQLVVNYFKRAA